MHPSLNIAIRAARSAGKILLRYLDHVDHLKAEAKGRNDFVSDVDRLAEATIIKELQARFPGHSILAEESGLHGKGDYQWIIDPLDGTTNYLHGFPQFSVSIALKHKGQLECGVVYDPLREEMFTAARGEGAQLNDRKIRVAKRPSLNGALIGTGFPFRDQRHIDAYMGMFKAMTLATAGLRRPGSAALDLAYVAAGRTDGFWELGLSEWDCAAGALLVQEAGGTVTDLGGGNRFLETGNLVAGNVKVHKAILETVAPFRSEQLQA
ncbi:inositol monophosphatase [Marichromatium purpuratum 984]|uniref:Inositol-1-monophosphatase n=1 Tax=Marichromatium purpuratum 984 TaxID=765910 RepID=W0E6G6_MARPU|nr:inositol monophosphatase family protein [Marichromatium purpuratum]AHF04779.1 inositol monophosphatase [Marichromatium purpuratum 984]